MPCSFLLREAMTRFSTSASRVTTRSWPCSQKRRVMVRAKAPRTFSVTISRSLVAARASTAVSRMVPRSRMGTPSRSRLRKMRSKWA